MQTNRRSLLKASMAGAIGFLGGVATRLEAHTGTLSDADVKKLALEPQNAADYQKLAAHFRALKSDAEEEAAMYEAIAKTYRNAIKGGTQAQGRDAARALEHVAEHARDSAEALDHLVETYTGLAESFNAK